MNLDKSAAIGVFDSGIGGLTVAREIIRNLPNESIVYFGDTARVPYGSKSKKTIVSYSRQIVNFLKTQNVKTIVIACNTASALALDTLEKEIDIPIIGVVKPGTTAALKMTRNKNIGVIATSSTIESGLYPELIHAADGNARVFSKSTPLLCPLVEEGWSNDEITDMVLKRYLEELLNKDIDTLILGCTHYPLLRKAIARLVGDGINLVNPAYETAISLKALLNQNGLENDSAKEAEYSFYSSDDPVRMLKFVDSILGCKVRDSRQILIEKY